MTLTQKFDNLVNPTARYNLLFAKGSFVISKNYCGYKLILFEMDNNYFEVWYNHQSHSIYKAVKISINKAIEQKYHDNVTLTDLNTYLK